jgi:hypothetical protein
MTIEEDQAVSAIIEETLETIPKSILQFYRNIPGRRPSEHSKEVGRILSKLTDEEVMVLVRDIIDSALFSTLHLMDLNFKDRKIRASFEPVENSDTEPFGSLLEAYRERVDPGGLIVPSDQEARS